ncbi:hypothetical protein HanXRQr2_Chr12g0525501 [Helianthus annuus]|uniref:Uncharacterized protein n=1 Tax=Helianthus annuus TaxID=4232 RepID=A0A9K3EMI5_HELAN|nr:hypothetical protein HanXRQr2_Chr12g0525501 [Helianthus annuus]KAJ0488233.1 hypothetical protein HanHA300_Chr12g0430691 [Helianthus annuus]KAJ0504067.1 hypothetical protein HanHA89_Chr12g0455211 [Helianthus annuus]KAJ0677124.1 hypothetical protein HanOQP8_Chr12g0433441 [Helianthus annuus]KAJ0861407.1 hypothetical protein HanPSC8_Chr12g0506291 [Helianthus annuus]
MVPVRVTIQIRVFDLFSASLIPVAWFEIRVRYGSYLGSSLQPVSVQVRVMYQLGSVRCSGQTVNCRVKSGQSWSTKLSVQSGYGFGSSG